MVRRCSSLLFLAFLSLLGDPNRSYGQSPGRDTNTTPAVTLHPCTKEVAPSDPGLQCFENEDGWFMTSDSLLAVLAAAALRPAVARFKAFFGKAVGRGVNILVANDTTEVGPPSPGMAEASWTWKWIGITKDWAKPSSLMYGVNRHELGHVWLMQYYDWQPNAPAGAEYGGLGADWLDETAAVLMESDSLVKLRRDELAQYYRKRQAKQQGMLPLDTLLTMAHGDTAARQGITADALARAFADFLLERANDQGVLGAIATNEASGSNIAEWLKSNGPRYGLPTTIGALDKEWQQWMARRAARAPAP